MRCNHQLRLDALVQTAIALPAVAELLEERQCFRRAVPERLDRVGEGKDEIGPSAEVVEVVERFSEVIGGALRLEVVGFCNPELSEYVT
jgi:hypothetical protein